MSVERTTMSVDGTTTGMFFFCCKFFVYGNCKLDVHTTMSVDGTTTGM
jgi:hypothetical protein